MIYGSRGIGHNIKCTSMVQDRFVKFGIRCLLWPTGSMYEKSEADLSGDSQDYNNGFGGDTVICILHYGVATGWHLLYVNMVYKLGKQWFSSAVWYTVAVCPSIPTLKHSACLVRTIVNHVYLLRYYMICKLRDLFYSSCDHLFTVRSMFYYVSFPLINCTCDFWKFGNIKALRARFNSNYSMGPASAYSFQWE